MSYNYLPLDRKWLNFQQVKNLLDYGQLVSITFDAHERILKCREYLDNLSTAADVSYNNDQQQKDLLKSHAAGIGEQVPADIVKLLLMLKIKSLSHGHSGVHIETVKRLMEMYNNEVIPVVYGQGSSSTGGDSIALSHLALPLIGLGQVYYQGQKKHASEVLKQLNWQPLTLQTNEGLALITGTHFTSAHGMYALKKSEQLIKFADVIAALSFKALGFSTELLHAKIHSIHSHKGQVQTAATISKYLQGSEIGMEENQPSAVPYSFRCTPQVHGASKDAFDYVLNVFLKEINSVTEDPVIFPDENLVLSGGNFHGRPLALALDFLSMGISELASISERRIAQLSSDATADRNAHYKILQFTAASIVSENKLLCTPASTNSFTVDPQEDYVSMASGTATKCLRILDNVEKVLAAELMLATQLVEARNTFKSSPFIQQFVKDFRQQTPFSEDSLVHDNLLSACNFIGLYKL